jgi:hypothetical protein
MFGLSHDAGGITVMGHSKCAVRSRYVYDTRIQAKVWFHKIKGDTVSPYRDSLSRVPNGGSEPNNARQFHGIGRRYEHLPHLAVCISSDLAVIPCD